METHPLHDPLHANHNPRIIGASVTLLTLSTTFVALRLASRKLSGAGFWWDDALVFVAMILSWGLPICSLTALHHGHGRHVNVLHPQDVSNWFKILYIFEMFYISSVAAVKFSILMFYRRIFPIPQFKIPLMITGLAVLCFMLSIGFASIFECIPIRSFWVFSVHGRCVNVDRLFLAGGSVNVVLDFLILALPIPILWRLRTTKGQKTVLTCIFSIAAFVCIVSIIRLVVLSRLTVHDITWNFVNAAVWTETESSLSVVSACIPSLRPLVALIIRGNHQWPSIDSASTAVPSKTVWRTSKTDDTDGNFIRLEESLPDSERAWGHKVSVHGGRASRENNETIEEVETPPEGIKVKTEIILISTDRLDYDDRLY